MREETRQTLQLIIEKAAKLKAFGFESHVRESGHGFNAERRPEGDWLVEFAIPEEEERDAFLLTFRLFYQRNERISLPNLEALAQDPGLSDEWRREARRTHGAFQQYLDGHSTFSVELFEGHPSRKEMLDAALYGGLAHANNQELIDRFQRWTADEVRAAVFQQEFAKFLVEILVLIDHIARASEQELRKDAA